MRLMKALAMSVMSFSLFACQQQIPQKANTNTLKIKVSAGGDITVDGQIASLDQTSAKLAEIKKANGVVLYHRENPEGEPHPNAMKVIKLVADNGLPIRLCAKPDFSDSVDDKGLSRPGK